MIRQRHGSTTMPHSEACRARIEGKLREDADPSVQRTDERINSRLAERLQEQEEEERPPEGEIPPSSNSSPLTATSSSSAVQPSSGP